MISQKPLYLFFYCGIGLAKDFEQRRKIEICSDSICEEGSDLYPQCYKEDIGTARPET